MSERRNVIGGAHLFRNPEKPGVPDPNPDGPEGKLVPLNRNLSSETLSLTSLEGPDIVFAAGILEIELQIMALKDQEADQQAIEDMKNKAKELWKQLSPDGKAKIETMKSRARGLIEELLEPNGPTGAA